MVGFERKKLTMIRYADCIFLWYFCTDHVAPGWPSNQGKCQQLLTYCSNYIEDKKKAGGADKPFFTEKEVEPKEDEKTTSDDMELVEGRVGIIKSDAVLA